MFPEFISVLINNTSGQYATVVTSGSAMKFVAVPVYGETDASNFQEEAYAVARYSTITTNHPNERFSTVVQAMLASEDVLRRDWDTPEEDAAWANL